MPNLTYEETVRGDAVIEMYRDILRTIIDTLRVHGNDNPTSALAMIAAALIMSIDEINHAFETEHLSTMILEMLKDQKRKNLQ